MTPERSQVTELRRIHALGLGVVFRSDMASQVGITVGVESSSDGGTRTFWNNAASSR